MNPYKTNFTADIWLKFLYCIGNIQLYLLYLNNLLCLITQHFDTLSYIQRPNSHYIIICWAVKRFWLLPGTIKCLKSHSLRICKWIELHSYLKKRLNDVRQWSRVLVLVNKNYRFSPRGQHYQSRVEIIYCHPAWLWYFIFI